MSRILGVAVYSLNKLRMAKKNHAKVYVVIRDSTDVKFDFSGSLQSADIEESRDTIRNELEEIAKLNDVALSEIGLKEISIESLPPAFNVESTGTTPSSIFPKFAKALRHRIIENVNQDGTSFKGMIEWYSN